MTVNGAQYLLPRDVGEASARRMLAEHLRVEVEPARPADRTFYDTFDGRLHSSGLVLVHTAARLALVDATAYSEQAALPMEDAPERILVDQLPAGSLRDLLEPIVDVRALTRIARVRSRVRPLRVLDGQAKTVVRLVIESPVVAVADGRHLPLGPRLHVAGVRGYDKQLDRVRGTLERDLGLTSAGELLHDEAVAVAGGAPGGTSSKLGLTLAPRQRADAAAVTALERLLEVIEVNLPGTVADVDSEFLHDLRVAVRRTRSVQRQVRQAFPPGPLEHFRAEFRWLQQATGPARDLDVYVLEFDRFRAALPAAVAPDLEPLRGLLERRRLAEQRRAARALRSERTTRLLAGWAVFLEGVAQTPEADRPAAARPIRDVAGERVGRVYRRMVRAGGAIDELSPPEALHDLRKQGKELRYLLEIFGGMFPAEVVKPMVATLKSLQDTLGRFQDREVQAAMLRSLREEVAAVEDGPAALMAMGLLVERLEQEQTAARAEFAERFAAFAAGSQQTLVTTTFA